MGETVLGRPSKILRLDPDDCANSGSLRTHRRSDGGQRIGIRNDAQQTSRIDGNSQWNIDLENGRRHEATRFPSRLRQTGNFHH